MSSTVKDHRGRTPRFVMIEDPSRDPSTGARIILNQFTGRTARCNKYSERSVRIACRKIDERKKK